MLCKCQQKKRAELSHNEETIDSPLQVRLVKMLGLKNYVLQKFVFRRKTSTYSLKTLNGKPRIFLDDQLYTPPDYYTEDVHILEMQDHSVPIVRLTPTHRSSSQTPPCIIYAHGNSSDLGDSLFFISSFAAIYKAQYIVFDYTGYGVSRMKEVGEEVICQDLKMIIAWANQPLDNVILWGFSLGTYPVVVNAARMKVRACILQCPIGSLSCMFYDQYAVNVKFKDDHFANIDLIADVSAKILMMHSVTDQIIPVEQARLLYNKFVLKNGDKNMEFIQVEKIKHNAFHRYIASDISNEIQNEVIGFLSKATANIRGSKLNLSEMETTFESSLFPKELTKMQQRLVDAEIQEHSFDQQSFEIIQANREENGRVGEIRDLGWLCWGK